LLYIAMELSWFILSSPDKETMLSRCLGSASQPPGLDDGLCMLEGILQIVRIWYWIYANLFSPKGAAQSAQWSHVPCVNQHKAKVQSVHNCCNDPWNWHE
jgi:hypothetical protein